MTVVRQPMMRGPRGAAGSGGLDQATADIRYVNVTGDTVTGALRIVDNDHSAGMINNTKGQLRFHPGGVVYVVAHDPVGAIILRVGTDTLADTRFDRTSITFKQPLVLPADPTLPLHAATKQYVDTKIAAAVAAALATYQSILDS